MSPDLAFPRMQGVSLQPGIRDRDLAMDRENNGGFVNDLRSRISGYFFKCLIAKGDSPVLVGNEHPIMRIFRDKSAHLHLLSIIFPEKCKNDKANADREYHQSEYPHNLWVVQEEIPIKR